MKIIISYPPLETNKGSPTLGQNRQFQFFKDPTYIYPVIPATAATMLKKAGHQVIWNDCLAEGLDSKGFMNLIQSQKPDIIAFETKTPVVKKHWQIINNLKSLSKGIWDLKIVLFGDHVTALPEESFGNSDVDFVLTGGDYDFLLKNLCQALELSSFKINSNSISKLEPGIYFRDSNFVKNTGEFQLNHDLNSAPFIDRPLTKWPLYAYKNGNYKRTPGTYIMSGRDCWWGKCTFCSWPTLYPKFRNRTPDNVLNEIGELISNYKIREIMDDTGTLPVGDWLNEFTSSIIKLEYNKKVYFDCNMRFGALSKNEFNMMKRANFRLLLFGLESANQATLDRLNKNVKVEQIIDDCKHARASGLYPHITIMFGYPWETYGDALKTLKLGRWLLKKGYACTMQATLVIPYPGSRLFAECERQNLLLSHDWDLYDMKQPIMATPGIPATKLNKLIKSMYDISFDLIFIARKIASIRDLDDLRYYSRIRAKIIGHILDFNYKKNCTKTSYDCPK